MPRARLVPLLVAPGSCTDPAATTTDAGGTSSSVTGDPTGAPTTTDAPTTTSTTGDATGGASSTTEPGFDPPTPVCGNGYREGDEECDDGNDVPDDGCTSECTVPCGLEAQVLALAPSAQSDLWADSVASAPDGGVVVVAHQRTIVADQEGMQTIGPVRTRVLRYGPDLAPLWDVSLGPEDAVIDPTEGVVDAAGDVYVAATVNGADLKDIRVVKLAGADGKVKWTFDHDGAAMMSDDIAQGLALAPDGAVIVAGRVADVEKDDDVWVRKLKPADGAAVWTTTWSGAGNGEFSVDQAGRVAVAPDGSVYVGAREYVDFDTIEGVLLKFGKDGGKALWTFSPLADGAAHTHVTGGVSADKDGNALVSIHRTSGAAQTFWLYKLDPSGKQQWSRDLAFFADVGDKWSLGGAAFDSTGGVVLGGSLRMKDEVNMLTWYDGWTARLDPAGERRCQLHQTGESVDLLPPSLNVYDAAVAPGDAALLGGQQIENGEQQLWVGRFRPL